MKEVRVITITLSILLIISLVAMYFTYKHIIIFNIVSSIATGLVVSIITALCQYFVIRGKIKNNVFNSYFQLYTSIYMSEQKTMGFHYNVSNIYTELKNLSVNLEKYVSEYSGFIPNNKNKLYKKLNPSYSSDFKKIKGKNFVKLSYPFNLKTFKETIIPFKEILENILIKIDKKKFKREFIEFKKIYKSLWE